MSRILQVTKPFFVMEVGDTFELSQDENEYVSSFNMERKEDDNDNDSFVAKYSSSYTISKEFAQTLIKGGFLKEVEEKQNAPFVNVFDEINTLIDTYQDELNKLDADMANMPACLKVEKETVLNNLITVLEHLNSLRK